MSHGSAVLICYMKKKKNCCSQKERDTQCEKSKEAREREREHDRRTKEEKENKSVIDGRRTRPIDQREIEGGINEERKVANKGKRRK